MIKHGIQYVFGDLVEAYINGDVDVIAHQCNCFCTMGSGIARTIKEKLPKLYEADLRTVRGDPNKLGMISMAVTGPGQVGYNLYGQFKYGRDKQYTDYIALRNALKNMNNNLHLIYEYTSKNAPIIGLPKIGAGLGGGDWNTIIKIIEEELAAWQVKIYVL